MRKLSQVEMAEVMVEVVAEVVVEVVAEVMAEVGEKPGWEAAVMETYTPEDESVSPAPPPPWCSPTPNLVIKMLNNWRKEQL